jgi:hypothetical protein
MAEGEGVTVTVGSDNNRITARIRALSCFIRVPFALNSKP